MIALLLVCNLLGTACNKAKKESSTTTETTSGQEQTAAGIKPALNSPQSFKSQVDEIATGYLATKDALVASDTTQANAKVSTLLEAIAKVDTTALLAEVQQKWLTQQQSLEKAARQVQNAQGLEAKRTAFEDLSASMYQLVTDFGTTATLYKQYCPMAFNDKGAYWLSAQSEIKNPYFGDAMLTCGEVQETLTFAQQ